MMARYDRDYAGREHFGEDQAKALVYRARADTTAAA